MTSRRMLLSGSLLLGALVLPAAAETTGERALLNRSDVRVAAPAAPVTRERRVDGERALLNRPAAGETVAASRPSVVPGSSSAGFHRFNGERALLGRVDFGSSISLHARQK